MGAEPRAPPGAASAPPAGRTVHARTTDAAFSRPHALSSVSTRYRRPGETPPCCFAELPQRVIHFRVGGVGVELHLIRGRVDAWAGERQTGCWGGTVERIREGRPRVWEVGWCVLGCDSRGGVERTCMTRQSSSRVTSTISTALNCRRSGESSSAPSRSERGDDHGRGRPCTASDGCGFSPSRPKEISRYCERFNLASRTRSEVGAPVGVDDVPVSMNGGRGLGPRYPVLGLVLESLVITRRRRVGAVPGVTIERTLRSRETDFASREHNDSRRRCTEACDVRHPVT